MSYSHFGLVAMALMESSLLLSWLKQTFMNDAVAITIRYLPVNFKSAYAVQQDFFTGNYPEVPKATCV